MAMDGDAPEGCQAGISEEIADEEDQEIASESESSQGESGDLVGGLIMLINYVSSLNDYRRTQRKECFGLVRRLKLILPLLEEIAELGTPLPDEGVLFLLNLKKSMCLAKRLLKTCNEGSKIYLANDSEVIHVRFNNVYEKLSEALEGLPDEVLGISDEIKEQAHLTCKQLRRAKRQTDTQDIEFVMDIMVVFSDKDDRNADSAILERLATRLELRTPDELKAETIAVRKLVKQRAGRSAESTQKILDVLKKFKQVAGIEENDVLEDFVLPEATEEECSSVPVPQEFLCPISSDIMMDPVTVATGETYERENIQTWLDSNNTTCPKTGQPLSHTNLAPNSALKTQIMEWCENNNFQLPKKEVPPDPGPITEQQKEMMSLVQDLSSSHLKVQRKAAKKIRLLSKENPENRVMAGNLGAIPPLVQLLSYPDSNIREHAVTALLNLSIDEGNKRLITNEDAIPAIIDVLKNGTVGAKENSAAALFSLSMLEENREKIGAMDGIPPLVELLQNGTARGKKDALTALFNLSLNTENKSRAIAAGMVKPLLNLVEDKQLGLIDEALSVLLLVAGHPSGRQEMAQMSLIEKLVDFIKEGTPKNKECATSVLLELCTDSSSSMLTALQFGVYEYLVEVASKGTSRAQRKANSLLQLMCRSEQIP
ncbi:hypothetical protein QQ045_029711 [Rhodiola kirilowii]